MNLARWRRRSRTAGFTLVEALVATLLMAMILTALATVTAQWLPNWNRGFVRVQRVQLLAIAVERLVADFAAAEFVPPSRQTDHPLFEGTELSATFIRSAIGPNARSGLEIVRISETADRQGTMLVRSRAVFTPGIGSIDQLLFRRSGRAVARALSCLVRLCGQRWRLERQLARPRHASVRRATDCSRFRHRSCSAAIDRCCGARRSAGRMRGWRLR